MELTDIFEFISPNAIRIKGTRIDIEFVIEEFLAGSNPKRIQRRYPHLTPLQDIRLDNLLSAQPRADGCLHRSRSRRGKSRY